MAKRANEVKNRFRHETEMSNANLARVTEHMQSEERIILQLETDYTIKGRYGNEWLVVTNRQIIAVRRDELVVLPLVSLSRVSIIDFQGNSILRVIADGKAYDLVRFSRTLSSRFAEIPIRVERLAQEAAHDDRSLVPREDRWKAKSMQRSRCPECGGVIPRRHRTCPACLNQRKLIFRLLSFVTPHWRIGVVVACLLIAYTFISLAPPLIMRTITDSVFVPATQQLMQGTDSSVIVEQQVKSHDILAKWLAPIAPNGSLKLLYILVSMLVIVHITAVSIEVVRGYLISKLGQNITYDLRNRMYAHLQKLSLSYFSREDTGRIMQRVTGDVRRLQDFLSNGLNNMFEDVLTLVSITIALLLLNPRLAVLIMIPTPLLVVTTLIFSRALRRVYSRLWKRYDGLSSILADTIPGMRVVKAFAQEDKEVARFEKVSRSLLEGELAATRLNSAYGPIMGLITYAGTVMIWWLGGKRILAGTLTLGELTAFSTYMARFYQPVRQLCNLNRTFQQTASSAERVFDVLDTEPELSEDEQRPVMPPLQGKVEFSNVTFAYDPGHPVLKNMSFTVEPGEMIGLAGHSGAGKSTLINMITGFYIADDGQVLVDGHDISQIDPRSLRSQIGVVLQDPFLFNGTIAENIAYGKPGATLGAIVAAAKAANAHEFIINFPDGYDTRVGERGTRLSGGERQRLAIARAILKDPRILILDEATASVDTETEAKIQEALERLIQGRTTFAIAHRLSTLRNANRLFILERGEMVEVGTHDELLRNKGVYARLCQMQAKLAELNVV